MKSILLLALAFGVEFCPNFALREEEFQNYLELVGDAWNRTRTGHPLGFVNYVDGWRMKDQHVNHLVGIVCGNFEHDLTLRAAMIEIACGLFGQIATNLLAGFWEGLVPGARHARDALLYRESYMIASQRVHLTYSQVREMFPLVCANLPIVPAYRNDYIGNVSKSCQYLIGLTKEWLIGVQSKLVHVTGLYSTSTITSTNGLQSKIRFEQVKTFLPLICEHDHSENIKLTCGFFNTHSLMLLKGNQSWVRVIDGKGFINHNCKKTTITDQYGIKCQQLFKESLEKLLSADTVINY